VRQFPLIPCTLCGSQDNLQRQQVGQMLREWEKKHPGRLDNMLKALQSVVPSHLMDRELFPFETLQTTGQPSDEGDTVFDGEAAPTNAARPVQGLPLPVSVSVAVQALHQPRPATGSVCAAPPDPAQAQTQATTAS